MGFINEHPVKAVRKARQCVACGHPIEVGQAAVRWTGLVDGDFSSVLYHPDCREAEVALNKLCDTWAPDEWIGLRDHSWEDRRWLLEEHPTVADRMGITLAGVEETEREQERMRRSWFTPSQHKGPPNA